MLHSSCVLVADPPPPSSIRHFYRALSSKGRHYDPSHVAMWPCWRHAVVWLHSQQAVLPEQPSWPELRGYCSQRRPRCPYFLFHISSYFVLLQDVGLTLHPCSPEITIKGFRPRCCLQMQHVLYMYMQIQKFSTFWYSGQTEGLKLKKSTVHILNLLRSNL